MIAYPISRWQRDAAEEAAELSSCVFFFPWGILTLFFLVSVVFTTLRRVASYSAVFPFFPSLSGRLPLERVPPGYSIVWEKGKARGKERNERDKK